MATSYLITRKRSLRAGFDITDEAGMPQFEVHGRLGSTRNLSLTDAAGAQVAVLVRRGLSSRYEIIAGGQRATVRPTGLSGRHFEIGSTAGQLEARGNFSGRTYSLAQAGAPVAAVTQLRTVRERFSVEIADGQDPVLLLAVVVALETIRDNRRRAAASSAPGS